jgi:dTDP-4-amino-4,6-dideoxygalactose transaminase
LIRAIVAAGHRPVFVDVDAQTLTMDPDALLAKQGRFAVLVVVHLFGQLADMPALLQVAGKVPVIEDAAHAPLSYLDGRMAGKFGQACFYSFASTKYWPAGGGGLAVVHDSDTARRFATLAQGLMPLTALEELRSLCMQGAKAAVFTRRLYGVFGKPMRRWAEQWALLEPRLDQNAMPNSQAAVAARQAALLPQRVEQQRANSLRLLSQLGMMQDVVFPHERPGARYNYHLFPVLLRDEEERSTVMAAMWGHFVDTSMIYSHVVRESREFGYHGGCPVAESIASRLITLPNYASLTSGEIDHVAHIFLESVRAHRNASSRCHSARVLPRAS